MEEAVGNGGGLTWQHRTQLVTHILTSPPTTTPSLYSQLFVAANLPLDQILPPFYPPLFSSSNYERLRFSISLFLDRALRFGIPRSSWRSKCPFQQPPPMVISVAVPPPPERWGSLERREYVCRRLRRPRLGLRVPPVVAVVVPNLALLSLLLLDPLWIGDQTVR